MSETAKSSLKFKELQALQDKGAGITAFTPQIRSFTEKYAGKNQNLALQLDHFDVDEFSGVLPGLTEPQQRVLDVALRYWKRKFPKSLGISKSCSLFWTTLTA